MGVALAPAAETETAAPPGDAPASPAAEGRSREPQPWQVPLAMGGLALLLIAGFFVYLFGLSYVSEQHAQAAMLKNFAGQLAQGTAPVAPYTKANGQQVALAEGTPVAALTIPALGLRDVVVVEGTSSRDLALGPGHVASSALPGQAGVSFLYGKMATYGAPFAHLEKLNRGDKITVTTGQGVATYVVESFGTSSKPAPADAVNRLVLETGAPSFVPPDSAVQVSADLVSAAAVNPGDWPAIASNQSFLGRDTDALIPLTLWSQALLVAVIIATFAAHRWNRWITYLLMAPVVMALTWSVYENAAALLPNLY